MGISRVVRLAAASLVGAAALVSTRVASAQQVTFELDRGLPPGAPDDGLALVRPVTARTTRLFAQAALGFGLRPLRARTIAPDAIALQRLGDPVSSMLVASGSVGVDLFDRATLLLAMPVTLLATGSDPSAAGVGSGVELHSPAAHDLKLGARAVVLRTPSGAARFAVVGDVFFPSGSAYSYASDRQVSGAFGFASEVSLDPLVVVGNLGVRFRPESGIGALSFGNELTAGAGLFVPMRRGAARIGIEFFGATQLASDARASSDASVSPGTRTVPVEWLGEGRFALDERQRVWISGGAGTRLSNGYGAPDFRAILAIGGAWVPEANETRGRVVHHQAQARPEGDRDDDGIPDATDLCPSVPEDGLAPEPTDGCPKPPDRDKDGIDDDHDKCPSQPEDFDGIDDTDGCPEDDVDADGIPDAEDACPRVPGARSTDPAKNGCKGGDVVEPEIVLLERVTFDVGKSTLPKDAEAVLADVVADLEAAPQAKRVLVVGHADPHEPAFRAQALSEARAQSVVAWLVAHGVARERLQPVGKAATAPASTDKSEAGRRQNRRVEFVVE